MTDKGDRHFADAPLALELDSALRLHPHHLNLGKAELLTDALTLPFTDIESRLAHYAMTPSGDASNHLAKSMKSYLGRLNANPHIPLKFRLRVLNRFEQELDLFDAEMTAAVLNAHKIGVALAQQAARHDSSYYPFLIDMIANAIELAVKLLLMNLEQYRATSVIVTRQFFDLARLALDVSAVMGDEAPSKRARLNKALCNHEMLRKIDFFAHTPARQQQLWQELQYHIGALTPQLYRSGDTPDDAGGAFMLINLNRPNDPGHIVTQLPNPVQYDSIVIGLDALLKRIGTAIRSVEAVIHDQRMQKKALHTEQALETTLIGGKAILAALRNEKRNHSRNHHTEARIQLSFNLSETMMRAFSSANACDEASSFDPKKAWNLIDISQHGICLERMHTQALAEFPDCLAGLRWQFGEGETRLSFMPWKDDIKHDSPAPPALGFIQWAKALKAGEQRIGIAFLGANFKLAKAVMSGGSQAMDDKRTWPILIRPGKSSHTVIFPETNVYKHMTFMALQGNQHAYFKISTITHTGQNYAQCEMVHARISG